MKKKETKVIAQKLLQPEKRGVRTRERNHPEDTKLSAEGEAGDEKRGRLFHTMRG